MKSLIRNLKYLKSIGVIGVKQSLEDEGASFKDIEMMRKITIAAKIDLNVKIGGCEAKNDIFFCKNINTNSIVAPMIESKYALKKFIQSVEKKNKILILINLETDLALKNLNSIIKSKYFQFLDGIVIGRSDIAGSMNLEKKDVNSKKIFNKVHYVFKKIKKYQKKKLIFKMGGSITSKSIEFIDKLYKNKLLHRIETRNIEIKLSNKIIKKLDDIIPKVFKFELEWLKYRLTINKKNKFIYRNNSYRINEMQNRLQSEI
jgi:hypothetical protein